MNLNSTVFYIGTDNVESPLFESQYIIPDGISYNSYLIKGYSNRKAAIIENGSWALRQGNA